MLLPEHKKTTPMIEGTSPPVSPLFRHVGVNVPITMRMVFTFDAFDEK
jgi:hypothetical protein